ncbi:transglutaminase family protein [Brachybacterium endophyticum]|uniref:Transglutaminase family protein n=2 Tax=Brachybacterium endophyticum TaxID=2182385 RepID=A0A2U2RIN0_9MICO|nr:transglutaminase family protein [Brachybacterium endophyticum]
MTAVVEAGTDLALLVAVDAYVPSSGESLRVLADGRAVEADEQITPRGNRMHLLHDLPGGELSIQYSVHVEADAPAAPVQPTDEVTYLLPSRYCEVDEFAQVVADVVGTASGREAVGRVVDWVSGHLSYVPGSSTVQDSARSTFGSRQGVCRDYAHLTATLLRAAGVPARCVSVFAPGLSPMDFHLVVEALVDGMWEVVDATHLAPRESMVRIASGLDAADTAFMTTLRGDVDFRGLQVVAIAQPDLPGEDPGARVELR